MPEGCCEGDGRCREGGMRQGGRRGGCWSCHGGGMSEGGMKGVLDVLVSCGSDE